MLLRDEISDIKQARQEIEQELQDLGTKKYYHEIKPYDSDLIDTITDTPSFLEGLNSVSTNIYSIKAIICDTIARDTFPVGIHTFESYEHREKFYREFYPGLDYTIRK